MKRSFFILLILFLASSLWAAPPKKVIYSSSLTTHFNWTWPYHPVEQYTAIQTKPYHYASRVAYLSQEDVSKYRFYYPEKTGYREWGYYFPPGTKLVPKHPSIVFGAPTGYTEMIYLHP